MLREANGPDDAVWRERTEQYLDLAQFMTHVAVENVLAENDGIVGFGGVNNFYLYRYAGTSRHRLLPWDKDNAFIMGFETASIMRLGREQFPIFARAWAQPDLRALFLDVAAQTAVVMGTDNWFGEEIERVVALITPAVIEDTRKQFSTDDYFFHVDALRTYAVVRPTFVLSEVATLR
jgi:hypothetical protein